MILRKKKRNYPQSSIISAVYSKFEWTSEYCYLTCKHVLHVSAFIHPFFNIQSIVYYFALREVNKADQDSLLVELSSGDREEIKLIMKCEIL